MEVHHDMETRFTVEQAGAFVNSYRAGYARYADNPEIVALMEEKLKAALKADGIEAPPMTADDRLKLLRQRLAAKGN